LVVTPPPRGGRGGDGGEGGKGGRGGRRRVCGVERRMVWLGLAGVVVLVLAGVAVGVGVATGVIGGEG
jgi:hypothetical protein